MNDHLIKTIFVEKCPRLLTRPAILIGAIGYDCVENQRHTAVFYQVLVFLAADVLSDQRVSAKVVLQLAKR